MNWYKLATRKIHVPANDYDHLINLVDKMVRGNRNWSPEELDLQQSYPEAVEVLLKEKMPKTACYNGMCRLARKTIQQIALEFRKRSVAHYGDESLKELCLKISKGLMAEYIKNGYDATVTQGVFKVDNPHAESVAKINTEGLTEEEKEEVGYTPLHYWVEIGNTIIDITASQFNDELNLPVSPIEIGTYASLKRYTAIQKDYTGDN